MTWKVESATSHDAWFREGLELLLSSTTRPLPSPTFSVGACEINWLENEPGVTTVFASGGTVEDRVLARQVAQARLAYHGYRPAYYTFDQDSLIKEASWDDIMSKAKRLIQSGNVALLRNGSNVVVGQVQGDHGNYQTEIGRDDPNSRVITQWTCECPWDQFAFQRTRQWKKYEARPCHLPGSMISMADGTYKPIEDVRPGDAVVTHRGVSTVTQNMSREYDGSIHSVYRSGFPYPVRVTPNHELWAIKTPDSIREARYNQNRGSRQGFRIYDDTFVAEEPRWIDANDLRQHDWVASTWAAESTPAVGKPFATVLGYYLAEGNLARQNGRWSEVQWTFHEDEIDLHRELYEALEAINLPNHRTYRPEGRRCVSIRITSQGLAERLLLLAGHLASNKSLAPEVTRWPKADLEAMLSAYAKGDGDLKKDGRQALNTSSFELARQLYDVLVRCGYVPSWTIQQNNGGPQNREARLPINRIQYKLEARQKSNGRRRYDSRYLSKIERIEVERYCGPVYNLSVAGDESYVAEGVTNHNCAHVLATYWKSLGTPVDDQQSPSNGPGGQMGLPGMEPGELQQVGPGHYINPGMGTGAPIHPVSLPPRGLPPAAPGSMGVQQQLPMPGAAPEPPQQPNLIPPFPLDQMQEQMNAIPPPTVSVPGAKPPTPANPVQYPGGTFSSWRFADQQLEPGMAAQMTKAEMGTAVGKSNEHGAGQWREIPVGAVVEVVHQDPTTGFVEIRWPLHTSGPMEPYHVECAVDPSFLKARPDMANPFEKTWPGR